MPPKTDLDLVESFRNGDVTAFNELVKRYQEKVYWIARGVVGGHADADHAVQDVFPRMYKALRGFRGESGFYAWLYRIAMNVSLNAVRSRRIKEFIRLEETSEPRTEEGESPDAGVLKEEYRTILERAVQRLPAKQKLVFVMRYYEEMPYEEMSKLLKKSVGGLSGGLWAQYGAALEPGAPY